MCLKYNLDLILGKATFECSRTMFCVLTMEIYALKSRLTQEKQCLRTWPKSHVIENGGSCAYMEHMLSLFATIYWCSSS